MPYVVDGAHNSNGWDIERTRVANNYTNGLVVEGVDSNAGTAVLLDASGNAGVGIYEKSAFGNTYLAPHFDGNVTQAIRIDGQSQGNRFLGVYKEGDAFPAVLIDAGSGQNFIDFRVLVNPATETVTDNSATGENVFVYANSVMRQNRLLVGNSANTQRVNIDPTGILFGLSGDTNVRRVATDVLGTDDDFSIQTAGKGLKIKEGTNAKMGLSTLVGGTVVVSTTAVTASSRIFLTCQTPGGTPGFLRVSARTAGTSFTILSSSGTDTSDVAWLIMEPGL